MFASRIVVPFALLIALLIGCVSAPPPATATGVAEALKAKGLAYNDIVQLPKPQGKHLRFDEAIALSNDEYWVEVIRVEDKKVFGIAAQAAGLLAITEAKIGRELPGKPEIYTRQPFIIVVRQEPVAGKVLWMLNQILPPK